MTRFQFGWHAATASVVAASLCGQLVSSLSQGVSAVDFFSYFTIQSNLLVLAAALGLLTGIGAGTAWFRWVRLAALTGITVTFVVYALLIGPHVSPTGVDWWLDKGLHLVAPLLAVLGQLVVGPRTRFAWSDLGCIAWPVAWLAWTLGRAAWGDPRFTMPDESLSTVPYDFLDVDRHGTIAVVVMIIVITAFVFAVAAGYVGHARRGHADSADRPLVT